MSSGGEKSFLQELWEKGFIRIVFSYLLGAWALLQFVDWLVLRYHISPLWTDLVFAFLLAMLPSVFLYTYYHKSTESKRWRKLEKIVIPSNVIVALGLVIFLFAGKSLSATASEVTITNESGEQVQRLVPSSKLVKRLVFFPSETKGLSPDEEWLKIGFPNIQSLDLQQDNRLYPISPLFLNDIFVRHGYGIAKDIPLPVQKQIAEENYADFFVNSSIKRENDKYIVNCKVLITTAGKPLFNETFSGDNLFELVDQFSEAIEKAIYLKDTGASAMKMVDLPSENLISADLSVVRDYQEAYIKNYIQNKPEEAIQQLKGAIEKDPNCAICYKYLATSHNRLKQDEERDKVIEQALTYSNILPERMQLDIKYFYYYYTENKAKAISLLEMWRTLYPSDYIPYSRLMSIYKSQLEHDKAVEVGKQAIEAGHSGFILTTLASIYLFQGKIEEAIASYQQFEQEYPNRINETSQLGYIYRKQGKLEEAKAHFEKIHLLDPQNYLYIGSLAQIEDDMGNFSKAGELYATSLKKAKLARDSARVLQWMQYHYIRLGQVKKALELIDRRFEVESQYLTPYQVRSELLSPNLFSFHENIGTVDEHYKVAKQYLEKYYPGDEGKNCFLDMLYSLFDHPERMGDIYEQCKEAYEKDASQNEKILAQAFIAQNQGQFEQAIQIWEAITAEAPDFYFQNMLGLSYKGAKQYDKAIEVFKTALESEPNQPEIMAEMAYVYLDKGEIRKGEELLRQVIQIWENADPEFIPAQIARAKLEEI